MNVLDSKVIGTAFVASLVIPVRDHAEYQKVSDALVQHWPIIQAQFGRFLQLAVPEKRIEEMGTLQIWIDPVVSSVKGGAP